MKVRRHHNNTGGRQVRRGKTRDQVDAIARRFWQWMKKQPQEAIAEDDGTRKEPSKDRRGGRP